MWHVNHISGKDLPNAQAVYNSPASSSNRIQAFPDKIPYGTKHRASSILWASNILSVELSCILPQWDEVTSTKLDFDR